MAVKDNTFQVQERKRRGAALLRADASNVAQVSHTLYLVRGSESPDYKVTLVDVPSCECKDFTRNGSKYGTCKHIEAARLFNRVYALIEAWGDDMATVQAMTGATLGTELNRLCWEAALSVLRYRSTKHLKASATPAPVRSESGSEMPMKGGAGEGPATLPRPSFAPQGVEMAVAA
jgi:hypothetical protein